MIPFSFELENGKRTKVYKDVEINNSEDLYNNGSDAYIINQISLNLPDNDAFQKFYQDFYRVRKNGELVNYEGEITDEMKAWAYYSFLNSDYYNKISDEMNEFIENKRHEEYIDNPFGDENLSGYEQLFTNYVYKKYKVDKTYEIQYMNDEGETLPYNIKLAGFYDGSWFGFIASESLFNKLGSDEEFAYSRLLVDLENQDSKLYDLLQESYNKFSNEMYFLENPLSDDLNFINRMYDPTRKIFLIGGTILAVFSILLFSNFIYGTIVSSKKEIGILRSLGARKMEVFKIFFTESLVIALANFLLSTIAVVIALHYLNGFAMEQLGLNITIYFYTWVEGFTLIGISLFCALIGTLIPVLIYGRKKPIDVIREL